MGGKIQKLPEDRVEYGVDGIQRKNNNNVYGKQSGTIQFDGTQGRWPSNIILSHSPDCVCVGTKVINENAPEGGYFYKDKKYQVEGFIKECKPQAASNRGQEIMEVWACVPDCPIRIMDGQSGQTSRFFYCAKAKRSEREMGLRGFIECVKCGKFDSKFHTIKGIKEDCIRNNHPTVKPIDLMRYLLTLIKMPNEKQIILDPFCGSGSTLIAAKELGINYIGIDQDLGNVLISMARIE